MRSVLFMRRLVVLVERLLRCGSPAAGFATAPYPSLWPKLQRYIISRSRHAVYRAGGGISDQGIVIDASPALVPQSWMRQAFRDHWLCRSGGSDALPSYDSLDRADRRGAGSLPALSGVIGSIAPISSRGVSISVKVTKIRENLFGSRH